MSWVHGKCFKDSLTRICRRYLQPDPSAASYGITLYFTYAKFLYIAPWNGCALFTCPFSCCDGLFPKYPSPLSAWWISLIMKKLPVLLPHWSTTEGPHSCFLPQCPTSHSLVTCYLAVFFSNAGLWTLKMGTILFPFVFLSTLYPQTIYSSMRSCILLKRVHVEVTQ